jgi:hypothetical protein
MFVHELSASKTTTASHPGPDTTEYKACGIHFHGVGCRPCAMTVRSAEFLIHLSCASQWVPGLSVSRAAHWKSLMANDQSARSRMYYDLQNGREGSIKPFGFLRQVIPARSAKLGTNGPTFRDRGPHQGIGRDRSHCVARVRVRPDGRKLVAKPGRDDCGARARPSLVDIGNRAERNGCSYRAGLSLLRCFPRVVPG